MRAWSVLLLVGCHVNDQWNPGDAAGSGGHAGDAQHAGDASRGAPDVPGSSGGGCIASPMAHDTGLRPTAPTAADFMWPGVQARFHASVGGATCSGQVTVAANDRAVCYVGADDDLHCAGAIYTHTYGPGFVGLGYAGADQIWLTPTANSETGNAICVHDRAGTAHCMGDWNSWGAFANGTTAPTAQFVRWSTLGTIQRIGGSLDTRCALDTAGEIYCAGYNVGPTATRMDTGGHHRSFWITTFGELLIDDPIVFRAANVSSCEVGSNGLDCMDPNGVPLVGSPGQVVDGTMTQTPGGLATGTYTCWLDTGGHVFCAGVGATEQRYSCAPPMLAIAGSMYTSTQCAVANDGSLWCRGNNAHGELGVTGPVLDDTMVQAPGSVKVVCQ